MGNACCSSDEGDVAMGNYYRNKKNSGYFRRTDFMAKQRSIEDIKYDRLMKKPYMRSRMDTLFE